MQHATRAAQSGGYHPKRLAIPAHLALIYSKHVGRLQTCHALTSSEVEMPEGT